MTTDPVAFFRDVASSHDRCFWLDGGGAREWSGRRSLVGWLAPEDVSLTYDAAARLVTRHADGRAEVVGDDPFAVLEAELDAGSPTDQWFGYFGYACRPDLPASTGSGLPDAVWMRPSHVRLFDHQLVGHFPNLLGSAEANKFRDTRSTGYPWDSPPPPYATAFAQVQEQLHAGNSYEVNLTYRVATESGLDPVASPSTVVGSAAMRRAISSATMSPAAAASSTMTTSATAVPVLPPAGGVRIGGHGISCRIWAGGGGGAGWGGLEGRLMVQPLRMASIRASASVASAATSPPTAI